MLKIRDVIGIIEKLAPPKLAYDWDNSGLQVGNYNQEVEGVLLTLDVNEAVLAEALSRGCQLIISHHPLIFKGLKSINQEESKGRVITKAIKNQLSIYSAHTNLDLANAGLNDYLAGLFNLTQVRPLEVKTRVKYFKLAVFVPVKHLGKVQQAILDAGAGCIGNYSHTSFAVRGEGSFKPLEGANPYLGEKGQLSKVAEYRLETIVPENILPEVISTLLSVHPYEEVAYDLYPLRNKGVELGLGRIGELSVPKKLKEFLAEVKEKLQLKFLKYVGKPEKSIKRVAFCSGSGADLITLAWKKGADLYLSSDIKYHEAQLAQELGLALIDAGHYETEVIVKDLLYNYLSRESKLKIYKAKVDTNPWNYLT